MLAQWQSDTLPTCSAPPQTIFFQSLRSSGSLSYAMSMSNKLTHQRDLDPAAMFVVTDRLAQLLHHSRTSVHVLSCIHCLFDTTLRQLRDLVKGQPWTPSLFNYSCKISYGPPQQRVELLCQESKTGQQPPAYREAVAEAVLLFLSRAKRDSAALMLDFARANRAMALRLHLRSTRG